MRLPPSTATRRTPLLTRRSRGSASWRSSARILLKYEFLYGRVTRAWPAPRARPTSLAPPADAAPVTLTPGSAWSTLLRSVHGWQSAARGVLVFVGALARMGPVESPSASAATG